VRLVLDAARCQGHSRCRALAPELVGADAFGQALVLHDGPLSPADHARALLVVANCPEGALRVAEDGTDG
jgi:ferredoxin